MVIEGEVLNDFPRFDDILIAEFAIDGECLGRLYSCCYTSHQQDAREKSALENSFEALYGKAPTYDALKDICCLCYATATPYKDKFSTRGIGYPPNQKGYRLYDLDKKIMFSTTITPFSTPLYTTNDDVIPEQTPLPAEPNTHQPDNEPQVMIDHVPIVSDQAAEPTSSGTSNDNPQVPLRRSQRNTSTPIWLKDFVLPKHIVFNVSKPDKPPLYPLFKEEDF
ncbi:hypothetical protein Tco_0184553 [Tanacetum coccineum]